jgi:hypothetical protein
LVNKKYLFLVLEGCASKKKRKKCYRSRKNMSGYYEVQLTDVP